MDVVTVSRLLGHASPSITLDKYGHALRDHQKASVEKLGALYQDSPAKPVEPEEPVEETEEIERYDFAMRF